MKMKTSKNKNKVIRIITFVLMFILSLNIFLNTSYSADDVYLREIRILREANNTKNPFLTISLMRNDDNKVDIIKIDKNLSTKNI